MLSRLLFVFAVVFLAQGVEGTQILIVNNGSGDGEYLPGTVVTVSADPPPPGRQFTGWTGDTAILANPLLATTSAMIPTIDVSITATYEVVSENLSAETVSAGDKIRFHPRTGRTERMIGGVFEGTNGDPVTGPYQTIHTVTSEPPPAWSEVDVNLQDYRYLRYRGPNGSYGNVAEIEFYRSGVKLAGSGFGSLGSWENRGDTFHKALDGDTNTFFDGPTPDGNYVGIDTDAGGGPAPVDKIRYYPRTESAGRMVGGVFEGTSGDPVTGPYQPIHTVTSNPPLTWTEVSVSLGSFRYLRYRGPNGSYGNVAEIEFHRRGIKLKGNGFGSVGSWEDRGNTFEKALDGDTNTFFDAPSPNGNYAGIDSGAPVPGTYVAINLGTLGGTGSEAISINDSGQVVGEDIQRATLFSGTGSGNTDLGTLGGSFSSANAISNSGVIVGAADLRPFDFVEHAVLFSGSGSSNIDLGTLGGPFSSRAYSVNRLGQVVGYASMPGGNSVHAALFSGTGSGNMDLGTLGGNNSQAFGINEFGQIVGFSLIPGNVIARATLFSGTGSGNTDLGTLGGSQSMAFAISNAGQIVGWAETDNNHRRATLFSGTGSGNIDLGTLGGSQSEAHGINDAGQIVGMSGLNGFLYRGGVMIALTELVTSTNAEFIQAGDSIGGTLINNWGQIAARGLGHMGDILGRRALLLNPVSPLTSARNGVTNIKFVGGMSYEKFTLLTEPGDLNTSVDMLGGTAGSGGDGPYRQNRDVNVSFAARGGNAIVSDVVDLSGTTGETFADTIVLLISYDESLANALFGSESEARLGQHDPQTGQWVLAVAGNTGGTPVFAGDRAYNPGTDFELGRHGVDTASNTVWAVINRNGSFGVSGEGDVPPGNDRIRFYPRSGWSWRMIGGVFEGTSGDPVNGPYQTIHTVTSEPPQAWNEVNVNLQGYRYLRYRGPDNSYGNVAEIEFYRSGAKLMGSGFGSPGSWENRGNTFEKALDGNVNTFFDAPTPHGNYVGIATQ